MALPHLPNTALNSLRPALPSNYIEADKSLMKNLLNKNVYYSLPGEIRNLIKGFQIQYKINENVTDLDPSNKNLNIFCIF